MKQLPNFVSKHWVISLWLGLIAFLKLFLLLHQSDYLCNWDGYYYLIQVRAVVEDGRMHSTDYSLIYPYFTTFYLLIGNYILAYKIGCSLLASFIAVLLYYCLVSIHKNKVVSIFIVLFLLISPVITYLIIQFPKNTLGLVSLLFLISALINKNYKMVCLGLLLCLFSHRMCLVMGLFFSFFMIISRKLVFRILLLLVIVVLILIFFPVIISIHDIERFKGLFGNVLQFAPVSFNGLLHGDEVNWFWLSYVLIEFFLFIFAILAILLLKQYRTMLNFYLILFLLAIIMLFPFYRMDFDGAAYRFYLNYELLIPLWFVPLFSIIPLRLLKWGNILLILGIIASIILYTPDNYAPPYAEYQKITENIVQYAKPEQYKLVVVHKGLAEYFTFSTKIDALPWLSGDEVDVNSVLRITSKIEWVDFRRNLQADSLKYIKKVGVQYYAMPEVLYRQFVYNVNLNNDTIIRDVVYSNENPFRIRPKFVKRN